MSNLLVSSLKANKNVSHLLPFLTLLQKYNNFIIVLRFGRFAQLLKQLYLPIENNSFCIILKSKCMIATKFVCIDTRAATNSTIWSMRLQTVEISKSEIKTLSSLLQPPPPLRCRTKLPINPPPPPSSLEAENLGKRKIEAD